MMNQCQHPQVNNTLLTILPTIYHQLEVIIVTVSDVEIMARLEMLEAETKHLKVLLNAKPVQPQKFRIEQNC